MNTSHMTSMEHEITREYVNSQDVSLMKEEDELTVDKQRRKKGVCRSIRGNPDENTNQDLYERIDQDQRDEENQNI